MKGGQSLTNTRGHTGPHAGRCATGICGLRRGGRLRQAVGRGACWAWDRICAVHGRGTRWAGLVKAGSVSPSAQAARTQHQGPSLLTFWRLQSRVRAQPKAFPWLAGPSAPGVLPSRGGGRGRCFILSLMGVASAWGSSQRPSHPQRPHLLAHSAVPKISALRPAPAFIQAIEVCTSSCARQLPTERAPAHLHWSHVPQRESEENAHIHTACVFGP